MRVRIHQYEKDKKLSTIVRTDQYVRQHEAAQLEKLKKMVFISVSMSILLHA